MEFKIGDRVELVDYSDKGWYGEYDTPESRLGVVTLVREDNCVDVTSDDGYSLHWRMKDIKKLEKTMEDLQAGDIILDCDGDEIKILARVEGLVALSHYSEKDRFEEWKSVAQLSGDGYKLKVEEEVKEMTVAEVEALVGKKVKIVKE